MTVSVFDLPRGRRLDEDEAAVHPSLAFTDRDSYVAWVAAWKASWHSVVSGIREAKRVRRDRSRPDEDRFRAQMDRLSLRVLAFNHLQIRKAGKTKARQARELRLAA